MARANNGGWDFVKKGGTYQYKEDGWIAEVTVLEDNSTPEEYSFKLQVEKATNKLVGDDIFDVSYSKEITGYFNGMAQFYKRAEYMCTYGYIRSNEIKEY